MDPDTVDFQPSKPKATKKTKKRFGSPVKDGDMIDMKKGFVPSNTKKSTAWAMNCFREWVASRNSTVPKDSENFCPEDLLDNPDKDKLNLWISRFVSKLFGHTKEYLLINKRLFLE